MDRFPELAVRGETLELPARRPRGPSPVELRYASVLERLGDVALVALPYYLVLLAGEVFAARPKVRFSLGRVDAAGRRLEVESIRGEEAHGGGGQLVAVCRSGEEVILPADIDLSIDEAKRLGALLDEHVRVAPIATYR
ncbi:MAG: hypothetical protein ACXVEF_01290 [Polyangiales bacterium]